MEACVGCAPVDSFANVCSRDVYLILATRRAAISRWMWTSPAASPVASPRGEVDFPPCFYHCRFIHYILSYSYSCLQCGHSVLAGRGIIVLFAGGFYSPGSPSSHLWRLFSLHVYDLNANAMTESLTGVFLGQGLRTFRIGSNVLGLTFAVDVQERTLMQWALCS
jgi:hypothetical protein